MTKPIPPFACPTVAAAFSAMADDVRPDVLKLRRLIYEEAAARIEVGPLEETLKWGQPSYLTSNTKSGTTVRLGIPKSGGYGLYVHCQTRLIEEFRTQFPSGFEFDGTRGILFEPGHIYDEGALRLFIGRALTYRLRKKASASSGPPAISWQIG